MPAANHPVWAFARVLVVALVLGGCLAFGYSASFDSFKDSRTLVIVAALQGLAESVRLLAQKQT